MNYVCSNCGNSYQWHQRLTRHERKCLGLDRKDSADCLHEADRDVDSGFKMTETGLGLKMTETGLGLANVNVDSWVEMNETVLDFIAQRNLENSMKMTESNLEPTI